LRQAQKCTTPVSYLNIINWLISRLETGTEMLQGLNLLIGSRSRSPADKEILYNQTKEKLQRFVSVQFKILHTFTEMTIMLSWTVQLLHGSMSTFNWNQSWTMVKCLIVIYKDILEIKLCTCNINFISISTIYRHVVKFVWERQHV
jgi:hypothetical protein